MKTIPLFVLAVLAFDASAHGGRTNSEGCHNNRKTGGYHCHNSGQAKSPRTKLSSNYFRNCSEARAAGAAPLRRGDAGYRAALDRDSDGVACE